MPGTNNGFHVSPDNLDRGVISIEASADDWQAIQLKLDAVSSAWAYTNDISSMLGTDDEYLKTWNFHESVSSGAYSALRDLARKLRGAAAHYRAVDAKQASSIQAAVTPARPNHLRKSNV